MSQSSGVSQTASGFACPKCGQSCRCYSANLHGRGCEHCYEQVISPPERPDDEADRWKAAYLRATKDQCPARLPDYPRAPATMSTVIQMSIWEERLFVRGRQEHLRVIPETAPSLEPFRAERYHVGDIDKQTANELVVRHHYLHRKPSNRFSFGLYGEDGDVLGVCTFGQPASHHLQKSVCPGDPTHVLELNRLWVHDSCPRNSESFFVARALHALPAFLVVSYSDTAWGHVGTIYRALGFKYAGWTDMERKTPRYDYIPPDGQHTRESFRGGEAKWTHRVRRKPKAKYWRATGDKRERRDLERACGWPSLSWADYPVPTEHVQLRVDR